MEVVASNSPEQAAWAAYDAAQIALHEVYAAVNPQSDTAEQRHARFEAAQEVARLWHDFVRLFSDGPEPRPAA